jgi:hypothetical protein
LMGVRQQAETQTVASTGLPAWCFSVLWVPSKETVPLNAYWTVSPGSEGPWVFAS